MLEHCWYGCVIEKDHRMIYFYIFFENTNSTACLQGSGLNYILQVCAHDVMRSKSWFISLAAAFGSCTIVKSDVSSAKSFTLYLRFCVKSLIYIKTQRTQDWTLWNASCNIPQVEAWPFKKPFSVSYLTGNFEGVAADSQKHHIS